MYDGRPTYAEIDLSALKHNYGLIRSSIPRETEILAVVKADAYGHGFMDISRELETLGINAFGVAFLAEGIQLRKSGSDKPILLLGGIYPGQERKCIGYNLSTTIFTLEQAQALNQAASSGKLFRRAQVHLKIDTGMGRLGIPYADVPRLLVELKKLPNIALEGVISHFASADELDESGRSFTQLQTERFAWVLSEVRTAGFNPRYVHIANSAAALLRDIPGYNLIRPGIAMYGALPSADFQGKLDLKP
ncbi:MAG: alanine racemase, partial [Desulfuromonadaceae bacterium]